MSYDEIVETVSEILSNNKIVTNGLTLVYTLPEKLHKRINEQLFYKSHSAGDNPVPVEEFEVFIGGILIKFVKKNEEIPQEN